MFKRTLSILTVLLLSLGLVACGNGGAAKKATGGDKQTVTVTTSFLEDMVKQLAGDKVKVESIIPAGEDPHLYTPKSSDLDKLSSADLVLYHGLHFEGKMVDALEQSGVAVSKNFAEADLNTMDEDGKKVTDPHFWFDIKLYKQAVEVASEELQKLVPDAADDIKAKTKSYLAELDDLHAWNKEQLAQIAEGSRYLITPHDAFNYFARSYNFEIAAPQGVSTDSEVANSDMMETVDLIVNKKVKAIFTESTTNPERMEKLKEAVEAKGGTVTVVTGEGKELLSDSLAPAGEEGDTFIDMYKHNVSLIVEHLK
ncbi:metal ABC transporter solute-binding protein, Zn/Mn family [Streptococcus merionis]|uniref:metal ABC transporter solute-binding protein, Zn/Mn family n=1 Tax=Streptococcus merionis TaxID=400065 RepID=UPI0026EBC99C|nr:zinc ABC transporter substrate-binding protein [Streptococcus merionis]